VRAVLVGRQLPAPRMIAAATFAVYLAFIVCSIEHGFSAASFAFVGRGTHQPTPTLATYAPPGVTRGYDGQFALFIALDPVHARSVIDAPAYRYSHILYPALARTVALGSPARVPAALLVINLFAVSIGAFALARLLERRRRSPWPALLVAFYPGTFLAVARDLNEPLAIAVTALGLLLLDWASPRRVAAAAAVFAAAALARETTLIFPLALAGCEAWRSRRVARPAVLALSAVPYAVWSAVMHHLLPAGSHTRWFSHYPLQGLIDAPKFQVFQWIFVGAPLLLLAAAVAWTIILDRRWTPFTLALTAEIVLVSLLGSASFNEWTSSARFQIAVLFAAILALPALRLRPLQLAAGVLAFAPAVPVILLMFVTGPGPH